MPLIDVYISSKQYVGYYKGLSRILYDIYANLYIEYTIR